MIIMLPDTMLGRKYLAGMTWWDLDFEIIELRR